MGWPQRGEHRELICQSGIIGQKRAWGTQREFREEGFYWLYMAGGPGEAVWMPFLLHSTLQQYTMHRCNAKKLFAVSLCGSGSEGVAGKVGKLVEASKPAALGGCLGATSPLPTIPLTPANTCSCTVACTVNNPFNPCKHSASTVCLHMSSTSKSAE